MRTVFDHFGKSFGEVILHMATARTATNKNISQSRLDAKKRKEDKKKLQQGKVYMSKTQYAKHRGNKVSLVTNWIETGKLPPEALVTVGKSVKIDVELADFAVDGTSHHTNLAEARAKREHFRALEAELEYKQKLGELVPADQIEKEAFEIARVTRDRLLQVPDRISQQLASMKSTKECYELLYGELASALESISES